MKSCSCGKRYTAAEWAALPVVGSMFFDDDLGRWYRLELKNCACRSTMALEFPAPVEVTTEDDARAVFGEAA